MFNVEIDEDSVYLRDGDDEIVMWTLAEWQDDPGVVLSITAAIRMGYEQGPDAVRAALI